MSVRYDESTKASVRALAKQDKKPQQIKDALGLDCSLTTIIRWIDPERARSWRRDPVKASEYGKKWRRRNARTHNRKRGARQKQAFAALKREEQSRRVAKNGGDVASAYAKVRRAALDLDRATSKAKGVERQLIDEALVALHAAEDALVKASRGRS